MNAIPIRLVVADDHPVVIDGLLATLSNTPHLQIVGVARSFEAVMDLLAHVTTDVAVLDLGGMGNAPLSAVSKIRAAHPYVQLVVFSSSIDLAPELLNIGVSGYVIKEDMTSQLHQAIQVVATGRRFLSPTVREYVERAQNVTRETHVSPNELEVLRLLAQGLSTVDIAHRMVIDPRTVQNYITTLRRKLQCDQRVQLVNWYEQRYKQ